MRRLKRKLYELTIAVGDVIYLRYCPCCHNPITLGKDVCENCFNELFLPKNICNVCGEPMKDCMCSKRRFFYQGFCAPFYNRGAAKRGIYGFKFSRWDNTPPFFGRAVAECVNENFPDVEFDFVTSVPESRHSEKNRFDHAGLLARRTALFLELPFRKTLTKSANNRTQHELKYYERFENVEGAYKCSCKLHGETVLLIDDIKTTGATLNQCAKQLMLAGADKVYCASAVMSPGKSLLQEEETEE